MLSIEFLGLLGILCLVLVPTFAAVLAETALPSCALFHLSGVSFCPKCIMISEARTPLSVRGRYSEVGTEQSYCGLFLMEAVTFEWM